MKKIRDLLYLDFEKTASLFSQLEDGLLNEVKATSEASENIEKSVKGKIPIVGAEISGLSVEKKQIIESRSLHHNLLTKVEDELIKRKVVSELNLLEATSHIELRNEAKKRPYLLAEGRVSIEDFIRLNEFSEVFNRFNEIILWANLFNHPEYQAAKDEISALSHAKKNSKERKRKDKLEKELEELKKLVRASTGLIEIDPALFENLRFMIDHFLKEVITVRLFPFDNVPEFQVIANLKKDSFIDGNIDSLIRAYGRRPNVDLTILGLVTSVPEVQEDDFFENLDERLEALTLQPESQALEKTFFAMSNALENVDKMLRFTRYPNVTVYPLAIYRSINLGQETEGK